MKRCGEPEKIWRLHLAPGATAQDKKLVREAEETEIREWLIKIQGARDLMTRRAVIRDMIRSAKAEPDSVRVVGEVIKRGRLHEEVDAMRLRKLLNPTPRHRRFMVDGRLKLQIGDRVKVVKRAREGILENTGIKIEPADLWAVKSIRYDIAERKFWVDIVSGEHTLCMFASDLIYYDSPRKNPSRMMSTYRVTVTKGTIKPRGGIEGPFERTFTVRAKTAKSAAKIVWDTGIHADKIDVMKIGNPRKNVLSTLGSFGLGVGASSLANILMSRYTNAQLLQEMKKSNPDWIKEARKYIDRMRSSPKKHYAQAYLGYLEDRRSEPSRKVFGLGVMGAQAVEMSLREIKRTGILTNPDLYQAFHGVPPIRKRKVYYEPPPKEVIAIGELRQLNYQPIRGQHQNCEMYHKSGDTGEEMLETNVILATDKDGKNLYLVKKTRDNRPIFTKAGIIG